MASLATRSVLRSMSAKDDGSEGAQYLYRRINFDTPTLQTTVGKVCYVGVLPAYSLKQETIVRIVTSFGGTLIIGTSANTSAYGTSVDIAARSAAETYVVDRGYGTRTTLDSAVFVQLTTGATVGEADIWISYLKGQK